MRTDDIIALTVLTVAGVTGYLLYTKQIKWPEDILPNPFEDNDTNDSKKEEKDVIKDNIKDSAGLEKDFQDFISDPFKTGKEIIGDLIVPKNKDFKKPTLLPDYFKEPARSLDDLITDAFKGHPFRPYSGTKYRPYS